MWKLFLLTVMCLSLINQLETAENGKIRIPLRRQKSLREQLEIAPNLKRFGIDFEWLHKPHKYTSINDTIALLRYLDAEFYANVEIGQPPQKFKMLFDTAWYTSWVISSKCHFWTVGCSFHNQYNHDKSETYRSNGTNYIANEGSYNLTGFYSNDTFWIGNNSVHGQLFVEMTYVPSSYFSYKSDGLMALGFKVDKFNPFLYNMFNNKTIDKLLFSIYISRDQDSALAGDISLGFINEKHIRHEVVPGTKNTRPKHITYLPVNPSRGYWQFHMDKIIVNVTNRNVSSQACKNGCTTIIDSTSNSIIGPKSEIDAINKLIGANSVSMGRNTVKCKKLNTLPAINFVLAGKNFTLHPSNYIFQTTTALSTKCISAFVAPTSPTEENLWILGGAFLSEFYSIYDIEKYQIGFVTAA